MIYKIQRGFKYFFYFKMKSKKYQLHFLRNLNMPKYIEQMQFLFLLLKNIIIFKIKKYVLSTTFTF